MAYVKQLTKRKNTQGLYKFRLRYYPYPGATQVCETKWFESRKALHQYLAKKCATTEPAHSDDLCWEEALEIWKEKCGSEMDPSYADAYDQIVREFTRETYQVNTSVRNKKLTKQGWGKGANLSIGKTSKSMMSDFLIWKRDRRLKELRAEGKTVEEVDGNKAANKARMVLLALVNSLRKEGDITTPHFEFESVPKRKVREFKGKAFEEGLLTQYLGVLPDEARMPVLWMLFTGWRSTPTVSLQEKDVDEANMIATQKHKGAKVLDWPLNERLLQLIYMARQLKERKRNEFAKENSRGRSSVYRVNDSMVFINTHGEPWDHTSLRQHCQKKWKAAGLPHQTIHGLRRTFGTEAGKNFSMSMVQAALAHDCPESTKRYIDLSKMKIEEVSENVQGHIAGVIGFGTDTVDKPIGDEVVTLICPELGKKVSIPLKKAQKLFA